MTAAPTGRPRRGTSRLGIDVGGTKLLACLVGDDGRSSFLQRPTGADTGPEQLLRLVEEVLRSLPGRPAGEELRGLGLGFPGLTDSMAGVVRGSPILAGWSDVPLAARLAERLGVPCAIDNDVNNAARAELCLRAQRSGPQGERDGLLILTVGTGIGGALAFGGRLWTGASGLAGELGHVTIDRHGPRCACGRRGCVNLYASGTAVEQRLGLAPGSLAAALRKEVPGVTEALDDAAKALAMALADALHLLDLRQVVVGGGLAELGDRFLDPVRRHLRAEAFGAVAEDCEVVRMRAGYRAGALGAALLAAERFGPAGSAAAITTTDRRAAPVAEAASGTGWTA